MPGWRAMVRRLLCLAALVLLPGAASAFEREAVLAHVREAIASDRVPGLALAVIIGGELVLLEGLGVDAEGRPVTPQTGFRLGSMSKAFTALAAMRLAERGVLDLDRPVRETLPDFALADPDASARITPRHLLAHTSGIPERAGRAAADASLAEHVAALASAAPAAAPGERHIYASPNYLVLARMMEVLAGKPFAEVLRNEVLAPLQLGQTLVSAEADKAGRLSGGHQYWFGFPVATTLPEEPGRLATASLVSSAEDMARFLRFQLGDGSVGGKRLLSPAAMADMQRGTAQGEDFRYAMGWRVTSIAGRRAIEHGGILPDYRGKMVLLPDLGAGVVVLTNVSAGLPVPAQPTSHRLAAEIAAHLGGEPLRGPALPLGLMMLAAAAGLGLIVLQQFWSALSVLTGRDAARQPVRAALIDLAVVVALGFGLPVVIGLDWPELFANMPDLTAWAAAMAVLTLVAAAGRLVRGLRKPGR